MRSVAANGNPSIFSSHLIRFSIARPGRELCGERHNMSASSVRPNWITTLNRKSQPDQRHIIRIPTPPLLPHPRSSTHDCIGAPRVNLVRG